MCSAALIIVAAVGICFSVSIHGAAIANNNNSNNKQLAQQQNGVAISEFVSLLKESHATLDLAEVTKECSHKLEDRVFNGEEDVPICELITGILPRLKALKEAIGKKGGNAGGVAESEEFMQKLALEMDAIDAQTDAYFKEGEAVVVRKLNAVAPLEIARIDKEIAAIVGVGQEGKEAEEVATTLRAYLNEKYHQMRQNVLKQKFSGWHFGFDQFTRALKEWSQTMQQQMDGNMDVSVRTIGGGGGGGIAAAVQQPKSDAQLVYEQATLLQLTLSYESMRVVDTLQQLELSACPMMNGEGNANNKVIAHYMRALQQLSIAMMKYSVSTVNFTDEALDMVTNFLMLCAGGVIATLVSTCFAKFAF